MPHYAWWILAAGCLIQGGTVGLIQNTTGIFCQAISADLGLELSRVTLYTSVRVIAACAVLPLTMALRRRFPLRALLSAATLLFALPNLLMGAFTKLWMWYAAAALQGAGAAFLGYTTVPLLLGSWFKKHLGFAMGLSAAFTGIFGTLANPLGSLIIQRFGWRAAYLVFSILCLALVLPCTAFVVRAAPAEKGLMRLGEDEREEQPTAALPDRGAPPAHSRLHLCFILFLELAVMGTMGFTQLLPSYGAQQGLSPTAAALLVSLSMLGCTLGKAILGAVADRLDTYRVTLISFLLPVAGFGLLLTGGQTVYPAAFLTGVTMPASQVMMPLLIREICGVYRYERVFTLTTVLGNLVWAISGPVFSLANETYGGYAGVLVFCVLLLLAASLMIVLHARLMKARGARHS